MKVKSEKLKVKSEMQDRAASKIAGWMLGVQSKFAKVMNRGFSKLSSTKRKMSVIFFLLIGGGLSIYYICEAVVGVRREGVEEKIGGFQVSAQPNTREEDAHGEILLDQETWNKVEGFKQHMDSLKVLNSREYNAIIGKRPGLMDSIRTLEEIYFQSQKMK